MRIRRILTILPLLVILSSCGAGADGDPEESNSERTDAETGAETYSSLFADAMIELSRRMVDVTSRVTTVDDADAVEPEVVAALDSFAVRLRYIVDNLDRLIEADPEGFRRPSDLMELPAVAAASEPAEVAMVRLNENNPTAAIRLQYYAEGSSEEAARLLDQIRLRWERENGVEDEDSLQGDYLEGGVQGE